MEKLGTVIHGIGATEHLDSSGERIEVKGIDISSLTVDGLINFEHKSEAPSQLIGKIIEAVKIEKKDDCKNKHHEYFWEKAGKTPYLYIKAVLFDKFGHGGAMDAVAMLQFDKAASESKSEGSRQVAGFSIEGSRLDKEGSLIKKCIARKMSFTAYPCNKACVAEILEPGKDDKNKMISLADLKAAFKKAEEIETDLNKAEAPKYNQSLGFKLNKPNPKSTANYSKITPATGMNKPAAPAVPKRTFNAATTSPTEKLKVGDRIQYNKPKGKTGASIYKDPATWKSEDLESMSNARKAIVKKVKKSNTTSRIQTDMMLNEEAKSEKKMKRAEILKSISQEAYDLFPHKEELLSSIRKTMPNASENEVLAFAKTYAYVALKKQEINMEEIVKESALNEEN